MTKKRRRKNNIESKFRLEDGRSRNEGWEALWYALPLVVAALWTISGMIYSEHKALAIWLLFTGVVVAAFAGCMYWQVQVWKAEHSLLISARVLATVRGPTPEPNNFSPLQYAFSSGDGPAMTPIYQLMNVRLVNDSDKPLTVGSYRLECRAAGRWRKIPRLDGRYGTVYFAYGQLNAAVRLQIDPLDSVLADTAIPPHQSVKGWLLFQDIPTEEMRLFVKDIEGNANTITIKVDKYSVGDSADSLEDAGMGLGPRTDLSKYKYFPKHGD